MNLRQIKEIFKYKLQVREKPLVIQMPITSRCNSRCKTCNIWKYHDNVDIDHVELRRALKDPLFSQVTTVGINGGEFTLVPTFLEILDSILSLQNIKDIYCITNGLFPMRLFEYMELAKEKCKEKNVHIHLCLSVDGVGKVHEDIRGIPNCFDKTKHIIETIYGDKTGKYCDSFSVGCTISKHNIDFIKETQTFFESYKGLSVEYHCAIPNKRIKTFEKADYYVLMDDKKRLQTAEFFYERLLRSGNMQKRYQYFSNFYFLTHNGHRRINTCAYTNRDITIDENLNLLLCATASEAIGNLKDSSATELIRSRRCKEVHDQMIKNCQHCGHYSYHPLTLFGRFSYINFDIKNKYVFPYYDIDSTKLKSNIRFFRYFIKEYLKQIYHKVWKLQ